MSIKPYSGADSFIFISYSHADTQLVFPIIQAMQDEHYRVWYDEGIDPGTEWDENIAEHIQSCGCLIAFLSGNYLNSENCKDELNYARDLNKQRLLIYLDDITLPPGMAMRFNRLQSIYKCKYADENEFYKKLFSVEQLTSCKDDVPCDTNSIYGSGEVNDAEQKILQAQGKALAEELTFLLKDADGTPDSFSSSTVRNLKRSDFTEQWRAGNPGNPYAFIESAVASFLQSCSGSDKKDLTNGMEKKKLLKKLEIPDGSKVYMAHDDTLLQSGKNGFAIWEMGISARPLWSETDFVSWSELAESGTELIMSENNCDCYFISGNGVKKCILYLCGNQLRETTFNFLKQIQKTLNNSSR